MSTPWCSHNQKAIMAEANVKEPNKAKRKIKNIIWVCDKPNCRYTNTRTIQNANVVNDDVCDKCKKHIHEPLTKIIITE